MGAADSKLEDMMVHGGAGKFQARLAGKIHSAWQESRRLLPDGTRQPSWKTLRSSEPGVPSTTIDIANTKFFDLPDRWKLSNLNAARVIVSEILRHVKASTKGKIDSRSAKKLDLEFIEVAAHFTHQQWITEHQHSCDAAALIPYYLLDNSNKNFLRKLVRLGIDLYDPEEDRLDNTLFPPRDFVVVPLPSIEEDNVVSKGGKKRVMKPWESAFPGEEEDEEVGEDSEGRRMTEEERQKAEEEKQRAEEERKRAAEARLKAAEEDEARRKDPLHHYTEDEINAHHERDLVRFKKAVHREELIHKLHKPKIVNVRRTTGIDV